MIRSLCACLFFTAWLAICHCSKCHSSHICYFSFACIHQITTTTTSAGFNIYFLYFSLKSSQLKVNTSSLCSWEQHHSIFASYTCWSFVIEHFASWWSGHYLTATSSAAAMDSSSSVVAAERDCNALGGLFSIILNDLKVSVCQWPPNNFRLTSIITKLSDWLLVFANH